MDDNVTIMDTDCSVRAFLNEESKKEIRQIVRECIIEFFKFDVEGNVFVKPEEKSE